MSSSLLAAVLMALGGGLLIAAAQASVASRRVVAKRIDAVAHTRLEEASPHTWNIAANRLLRRCFSFGIGDRWGAPTSGRSLLLAGLASAIAVWIVGHSVLKFPASPSGLAALAGFIVVPRLILATEQTRAEARFIDLFPDSIDMIVRMLRAGLPISAAMRAVGSEAQPPVSVVFSALADQVDIGIALPDAMAAAVARVRLADFRFFAVAVSLQHATGGNLTATLDVMTDIIRRRRAMRLKAKAVTGEVRMTAYVLAAIPFVIIAAMLVFNPGYLSPLIRDPRGHLIIGAAIGSLLVGFVAMRQLMRFATRL